MSASFGNDVTPYRWQQVGFGHSQSVSNSVGQRSSVACSRPTEFAMRGSKEKAANLHATTCGQTTDNAAKRLAVGMPFELVCDSLVVQGDATLANVDHMNNR